ncbi:MAG: GAF domain-containing sensor histidine kinase [Thermomicrobiales bacterium]
MCAAQAGLARAAFVPEYVTMTLQRLKWLTIVAPLALFFVLAVALNAAPVAFQTWPGLVLIATFLLVAIFAFSEVIFGVIKRMQAQQAQQNHELLALHEAGLDIIEELDLETVLQRIVDRAAALAGARYGALALVRSDGTVEAFITTGLTPAERERIGPEPVGHGLLGVVLTEGQHLRLDDLTTDPRSVGFPPHHPVMRSLLAVPIASRGEILGNLYLTEKQGALSFTEDDEQTLTRFATQAAVAIQNARLHQLAQAQAIGVERTRIAREMHDSLAQVLGYVNTKAQAAQELLRAGHTERALAQIGQLGGAARDAYADVREQILGLRASLGPDTNFIGALQEYLDQWQEQSGVRVSLAVDVNEEQLRAVPPATELQLLRIVQEALSNVRKHAHATAARLTITSEGGDLIAQIADDGAGFNPAALDPAIFPRFGLTGMHERADALGGALTVQSAPGAGTQVTARVPLAAAPRPVAAQRGERDASLDR